MGICFNCHGSILLKKKGSTDFADKLSTLLDEHGGGEVNLNDNGYLRFEKFARWNLIDECKDLIEKNVDDIEMGQVWFQCNDEDGTPDNPFPFINVVEITGGKVYDETLETRLPYDWNMGLE